MDKVSVIIPVYNVEKYLARCFEALINQTYENIEIIPVDDASPDDSRRIIKEYAAIESRIKPILRDKNLGVSASRNAGIAAAEGEWLCFCDGDDWFEPQFIEKMLNKAKEDNSDFVICDYQLTADDKEAIAGGTVSALLANPTRKEIIALGPLSSCIHLIKRSLFIENGIEYPLGCAHFEELSVIPALAFFAKGISVINEPLYNYYQRGDGTSASNNRKSIAPDFSVAYNGLSKILGEEYREELEYHAIYALFYGEILSLCKQRKSDKEIKAYIKELSGRYPDYAKNKYIGNMGLAKTGFLLCVRFRLIFLLKLFARLHSRCVG